MKRINIAIRQVDNGFVIFNNDEVKAPFSQIQWVAKDIEDLCLLLKSINMSADLKNIGGDNDDIPF